MKSRTFVAAVGGLGVVGGSLALLTPSASARVINIGDGAANVVIAQCTDGGKSQSAAFIPGCSYIYLKPVATAPGYTLIASGGDVTWNNGTVAAGALAFPASGQTWPKLTGLIANATNETTPADITGSVDLATGKVTLNLSVNSKLAVGALACTLIGNVTLTSDGTESLGGSAKGSAYDPATGNFAVVSTTPASLTASGPACGVLGGQYQIPAGMGWYLTGKLGLPGGVTPTPAPTTPTPAPTPTPTPTPTPSTRKKQQPVKPLNLPARIADSGETKIVNVPVRTNAKQNAKVTVTGTPTKAAAAGEVRAFRTFKRAGALWVDLSGTQATRIKVRIHAPATTSHKAYRKVKVYRTQTAS